MTLDCTKIPVEKPKCLNCNLCLYSHYKFLRVVYPSGLITYLNKPFGESADKGIFITNNRNTLIIFLKLKFL